MPWDVPITVDGKTFNARFEGDAEPTPSQIEYAKRLALDPARGQSTPEGVKESTAQGFEQGFSQLVTGAGALVDIAGGGNDNALLKTGQEMDAAVEAAHPVSIDNQGKWIVKAGSAIGQAGSQLVANAIIPGEPTAMRIAAIAGLAGTSQGEQRATELNITDPARKAAMVLGYGAAEAIPEVGFGAVAERGALSAIRGLRRGAPAEYHPGLFMGTFTEGGEEVVTGIAQAYLDKFLAHQNPETPGFTYEGQPIASPWDVGNIMENFSLGAVAGAAMHGVQGVFHAMNPQEQKDTQNVASLPQELRKKAWDALQKVSADEETAVRVAAGIDENTASAMRVAFDGKRANALDEQRAAANKEFAPGWEQREKQPLQHSGEEHDSFFENGQWMVVTGSDPNGQPVFGPVPNAKELEAARQEFIKTGQLGEGMQLIQPPVADKEEATASDAPQRTTRHRLFKGPQPMAVKAGEGVLDARDPSKAYRLTGEDQMADVKESGQVRAKEGKMRGGREGETQWSQGDETLGYRAEANEGKYVIVAPAANLDNRQGGLPASEVEQVFKSDGKTWVDVTENFKPAEPLVTTPAEPVQQSYRQQEQARVQQAYPQSPELVSGIENANGEAGVKAFLEKNEPKAQLLEELARLSPDQLEEKMRSEGVDEAAINRQARAAAGALKLDVRAPANAILRARENRPSETAAPLHVKEARDKMEQLPQETLATIKRGISEALTPTQIAKTYDIPQEQVDSVFTALRVPTARREGTSDYTDEYLGWMQSNSPETAKRLRAQQKAAKAKREGPRVARVQTKLDEVMRTREFKEQTAGDFIDKLEERSGGKGFAGPRLIRKPGQPLQLDPQQQGEWDWYRPLLQDKELREFVDSLLSHGGQTIADASNAMDKMREQDLGEAFVEVARARLALAKELAAGRGVQGQENAIEQEERQALAFGSATNEPSENKTQVTAEDLRPGDKLNVAGEPITVRGIVLEHDPDTGKAKVETTEGVQIVRGLQRAEAGDVILEDGARFGRQILSTGETIWVEKHERTGAAPQTETQEPAPLSQTSRQDAAQFESRMLELINDEDINGITIADIQAATREHVTGEAQEMSQEARDLKARVQAEMRTPAEFRADAAQQARQGQDEIEQAKAENDSEKATTPAMLEWANGVIAEGNVNAGLNPRLLAAHSVRAAYWIMQNGNNFAKWSAQMVKSFGKGIQEHLAAIWNGARALVREEVNAPFAEGPRNVRISPLSQEEVQQRARTNAYGESLWEEANALHAEMQDRGDNSVQFSRTAEQFDNVPELVDGEPAAQLEDGTIAVVTDQVHVTLEDIRNGRQNETSAIEEAIKRTVRDARREAGEDNVHREAKRVARSVIADIQSAPQFQTLVDALWNSDAFLELDAIAGHRDGLTKAEELETVKIWIDDHFADPVAHVLSGNASINESMLPPGASNAARNVEQLIKDALVYPYLRPKARIRFSARTRGTSAGSAAMQELHGRFSALDERARQIRQADADAIRAINTDELLRDFTSESVINWAKQKLEHYAKLTETGKLEDRMLTKGFTSDYLPIYARNYDRYGRAYRDALTLVRDAVRKITGDSTAKYGYHDSSREATQRDQSRAITEGAMRQHAEAQARSVPDASSRSELGNVGMRASEAEKGAQQRSAGIGRGDVQSAINGLRGILPNVDNTWTGTRTELQDYLRHNTKFKEAWTQDWSQRNQGTQTLTPEAAFDDFVNHGLEGMEALTFEGRTYLMNDQIEVKPSRGGTAPLSARWVLIHENTHEVVDHILDRFPELKVQWHALRNRVNPAQLDRLAATRWTWMRDWRNNTDLHDRLVHEWMAERIAELEDRGKPAADSLLGRLMQWLRDVLSAAMGTSRNLNVSDSALLDFIAAARGSYQQVLTEAARKGVRFSAADQDGNTTPAQATAQIDDGEKTPVSITPPPTRRPYNFWSEKRRSEFESFQSNPNLPRDMFHFTQFLGEQTNHERITQSLAPMLEMSNRRLGGVDGNFPEVSQESTDAAYRDARALHERKTFARKYIKEFQQYYGTDEQGRLVHEGDAAVAVHQLNLMRYAVRLLAETGDTKLFTQMEPFANDVILSEFTTASGAGRLLNARSFASRSDVGIWTAIQLTNGAMHQAAASVVGEEVRDALAKSISSQEVKDEIQLGMDTAEETDDVAAELEKNAPENYDDYSRERAMELMDEQARAWDADLDKTLRRLDELEQLRRNLETRAANAGARPSMQEDIAKFEGDPKALAAEIERLKAKAKDLLQKLTQEDTSHESKAQRRARVKGHKTLSADAQAKALLQRYQERNKRTKRDKPKWRETFDAQVKEPQPHADFMAAMQGHGVTPQVAQRLYELADTLHTERANRFADQATKTTKGQGKKGVNATTFLNSIVKQILKTPLSQQQIKTAGELDREGEPGVRNGQASANPWNRDWVKQTFTTAFMEQGIAEDRAGQMADKLSSRFDDIMKRAQEKAAQKAGEAMGMKRPTLKAIGAAIRSGALDATNANPVIAKLAEEAGFKELTREDLKRLAELDDVIQNSVPTLISKAITEITRILAKSTPHKKLSRVIEQLFINGALSSLGVIQLNWLHPAYILPRMLATDLSGLLKDALIGKGNRASNIALMGDAFTSLWQSRKGMLSDAYFSLKNDAYQIRMLELLNQEHSLYRELMDTVEKLKGGTATQKLSAGVKMLWLSSDWVRRILSSADQTWGSVIQQYVLRNEAMRHMVQNLGMTVEAAHGVLDFAIKQGDDAQRIHFENTKDNAEAALVGRDVMRESLRKGISVLSNSDKAGEELMETADKTSLMELGNRRGEDSPWWDLPNFLLESFKSAASAVRNKMDKMNVPFGRAFTGFVSVASNILNRSAYFTPLGFARVWAKTHGTPAKMKSIYSETMATNAMVRARLNEAIASSIALTILAILRYRDKEDDDYMVVTGNGPQNNQSREAWLKQGHKPGMIEFRDGKGKVVVAFPYTRGGFDTLAPALTSIGALDDMDLNGHKPRPKDFNWAWAYAQTMAGNQIKQAQFFGIRELTGAVPSSDKPHALAGWVGYTVNPWTPWGGLTKSVFKIFSGQQEQGSVRSAFLANVPVAQIMTGEIVGPRLNFLGDQIGGQPDDELKKMAERASYSGFPLYIALSPDSKDGDIYDFIVRKGVAPAMPQRSEMETKNGFLDDQQWADFVKARGQLLKDSIRRNMSRIDRAAPADAQSLMETISRDATRQAKYKLKLN